jgi:iron complex outermembrane recepter protein
MFTMSRSRARSQITRYPSTLSWIAIIAIITGMLTTHPRSAWSQKAAPDSTLLEEITVTAEKRAELGQNVAIALTALTGQQLDQLGVTTSIDLEKFVPGLLFSPALGGDALAVPSIRGVSQNDFTIHHEGPVAIYHDDVYVSFGGASSFNFFDLNRIEALRGPQGTLFGRNATGGLLHFVSNRPTQEPEAYTQATLGRFDQVRFEGALSGPLSESLSARFAMTGEYHDPYMHDLTGPASLDKRTAAARARFDWHLSDDTDFLVTLLYGADFATRANRYKHAVAYLNSVGNGVLLPPNVNYYGTCPGCDSNGYGEPSSDPWTAAYNTQGHMSRHLLAATTDLEWKTGDYRWVWLNSFQQFDINYGEDSDATPYPTLSYFPNQSANQVSEEVRVARDFARVNLTSGVYFLYINGDTSTPVFGSSVPYSPANNYSLLPSWNQKTWSYAAFTQTDWRLTDTWRFTLGGRWTFDDKKFDYVSGGTAGSGLVFNQSTVGDLADEKHNLWSAKGQFEWRPANGHLMYAGVSRGVKGGGFNGSLDGFTPLGHFQYQPETLLSYEVGSKNSWFDNRLRLNADAFYYDYKNYQGFTFVNIETFVTNYNAHAHGGELELTGAPGDGWEYSLNMAWLAFTVSNVVLPAGVRADTNPPQAPHSSASAVLRKSWTLEQGGRIGAQADVQHVGDYYAALTNAPDTYIPAYWLSNARVFYQSADRSLDMALYCNNIQNKGIKVYAYDEASLQIALFNYAPPRWYGIEIRKHW